MSFIVDIKTHLESNTGLLAYPFHIPKNEPLPAIQYDEVSNIRDSDSNLSESNIRHIRMQFTIVSTTTKTTLDLKDQIENLYENYSGLIGTSKVLISRLQTSVALYNSQLLTYEYAIDVVFKVLL